MSSQPGNIVNMACFSVKLCDVTFSLWVSGKDVLYQLRLTYNGFIIAGKLKRVFQGN